MLFFLLFFATACAASGDPPFPQCERAEWLKCVPFTGKPSLPPGLGLCVKCDGLNVTGASRSPFPFLANVNGVAIRGYPFNKLSGEKLAQLERSEVHTLALIDAKIVDVKSNAFSDFSRLERLSLDSNRLINVKRAWFTGLDTLLVLILSNNSIKQIEPRSFMNLRRLLILDLENNLLQVVDPAWLFGLEGTKIQLILRSNAINSISPGSFQHLQLMSLDLGDNDLSCLDKEVLWGQSSLLRLHVSSGNVVANTDLSVINIRPGISCGDLDSFLSTISIQPPALVLASDGSLTDKLNTNTPEQCRQTQTTETSYKFGTNESRSMVHYVKATEKDDTSSKPTDQSTLQVSTTPGQDLQVVQAPYYILIAVVVSTVVMSALAGVMCKVCAAWLNAEDNRASDNVRVSAISPGVTLPGLLRSASLPARLDKTAPDDAVSCRSLPAVLYSIKHTYSEIPDDVAGAQRPQPGVPHVPVLTHIYSEIPDNERSGPMPLPSDAAQFPLRVVTNGRPNRQLVGDNRITSSRQQPGIFIDTYGKTGQIEGRCNPFYRKASQVRGLRARRQLRTALVSRPDDQGIITYVNATDAIMSRGQDVTRAHITFLTLPIINTYWSWEIPGEGTHNTPRRASLPDLTLPNTYWPWEIPGEGACNIARRVSLPDVTLPNTYWPWEIPGKGTCNTPQRASLPTVTLPNTYWPWEILGEGPCNIARRVSLPDVTLPNTYWPWEIPGEGTRNTPRRAPLPTVTLPNTDWPLQVPGEENRNTAQRASLPTATLPNTDWPWDIGEGTHNTARRASLPDATLPNTYWPWEIPGEGISNTP
ncbi:hypothetical protein Bbelb_150040 [Branchiostoma belcheri]|nr:hypothetical protein Bbelb_150040 [Branchiostoma belcheri]